MAKPFDSSTVQTDSTLPIVLPQASQRFADPAMELATRNILASYFGTSPDDPGLIGQQIPVPVQQVAGLSPLEIQARNLTAGLGAFGGQLAEAQELYRQAGRGFDPASAGLFADPRARALYEASTAAYDPEMGRRFVDQEAADIMRRSAAGIGSAAEGIAGQVGGAQTGAEEAARRARAQTEMAGADLRSAGQMGQAAALQGIAGLSGTGAAFDPSDIAAFQDPFTQEVIEAQQAEIARLGEQQKRDARAQQIRAGAFGGSRGAIQEAEIGRNVLQQQAKTGAELRSQGFQQAAQQAQSAFEQAQGRRQQAAQLTGSLGQAGAGTALQAAGQAGQLGLSAEQLAQRGALESGQLGLSGQQGLGSLLASQAGIGQNIGQLGLQGQQLGANVFGQQMDRTAGAAAGLGGLTQGQFGSALQAFGQGTGAQRAAASGIAGLGQQGQQMLGTQIQTLGQLGTTGRGIQQRGLDAQYTAATQLADEPFMRLQRGQQLLAGGAQFMPQFTTGYGAQAGQAGAYQQPSGLAKAGGIIGTLGQIGATLFGSDIRLKENIKKVDEGESGIGWYTWDWNEKAKEIGVDDQPTEGVIAQELIKIDPSAVMMGEDGYYRVDYSKVYYNREAV
jgi:hypothetical protein